jgi:IclR family pca regulon transcriptional regulator
VFAEIKLRRRGPNTIMTKKALREELEAVREAGVAINDQELTPDLYSIAAPIRNEAREVVAAVNMAAHSSMISLEELVDSLEPHLIATADRISARLGYRRDDEISHMRPLPAPALEGLKAA